MRALAAFDTHVDKRVPGPARAARRAGARSAPAALNGVSRG